MLIESKLALTQIRFVLLCVLFSGFVCTSSLCLGQQQDSYEPDSADIQAAQELQNTTIRLTHDENTYIGSPLIYNGKDLGLLRRDGDFRYLPVSNLADLQVISPTFQPHTPTDLVESLQQEFGNRYEVSTTERCVVVHPTGQADYWAEPFEAFINNFEFFFEQKQFELTDAQFPYIVIVLRSRGDFDRYMRAQVNITDRSVAGFYSSTSNRMVTYDPVAKLRIPDEKRRSWLYDSPTVLHESAHQLAFNRGIHNRFALPPLWISEGFATLFEARGFYQAKDFNNLRERANRPRLTRLRNLYRGERIAGKLELLITDDKLFRSDPGLAYNLAWGVTFYLSETQPEAFLKYLRADSQRKPFRRFTSAQRVEAFATHFGTDLEQLEADMKEYFVEKKDNENDKDTVQPEEN